MNDNTNLNPPTIDATWATPDEVYELCRYDSGEVRIEARGLVGWHQVSWPISLSDQQAFIENPQLMAGQRVEWDFEDEAPIDEDEDQAEG